MESRMFVYVRKSDEDKHNQIQSIPDQLKEVERTRQEQNLPKPLATFTDIKTGYAIYNVPTAVSGNRALSGASGRIKVVSCNPNDSDGDSSYTNNKIEVLR